MEKKKMNRLGNCTQDKRDKSSPGKSRFVNKQKNDFPFSFFFLPSDLGFKKYLYERYNDIHADVVFIFLFIEYKAVEGQESMSTKRGKDPAHSA